MFEIDYTIHNDVEVIKSIKYSPKYVKENSSFFLLLCVVLWGISVFAFLVYYSGNPDTIGFSIICAFLGMILVPISLIICIDIKKFSLIFDDEKICYKSRKKESFIYYKQLKTFGMVRGIGPRDFTLVNRYSREDLNKSVFFFSIKKEINFSRFLRKIRTSTGVYHGMYDNVYFISCHTNARILEYCKETINVYCENFDCEIIDMDRKYV